MNKITMYRGDSFEMPVFINIGNKFRPIRYTLKATDKLYIGVMEPNKPFDCSIVRKILTTNDFNKNYDVVFKLKPEETECLIPGKYFMEGKLVTENGTVKTVLPKQEFWILN